MTMIREFLIVGAGSFFGGGLRYVVSRLLHESPLQPFPLGTFAANVAGCLLFGLFSGLAARGGILSPTARLVLTTGFCGGFTTFSTFMNENGTLLKGDHLVMMTVYMVASLVIGLAAVFAGGQLAKVF